MAKPNKKNKHKKDTKLDTWATVPDELVRHVWCWPDGTNQILVDPSAYAESGTPICGEGKFEGDDMHYVRTEISPMLRNTFREKVEPIIQRIYDVLYFDSDTNCFDPNKEWDSAADFIEMVDAELRRLYPKPKKGTTEYPKLLINGG